MKRNTPDPLSPEERALADRLARLGPHDGPSPALDAKILAAAHAAAASSRPPQRTRRRWALSAIPGGLITGVGVAATMALAVGVVWQLRPISPSREAPIHEPTDGAFTSAEMIARPRQTIAPPPPPGAPVPAASMRVPAPRASADAAAASVAAAPPLAAAAPAPAAEAAAQAADSAFYESDAPSPAAPSARRQRSDKSVAAAAADTDAAAGAAGNATAFRSAPAYAPPAPAPAAKPGQDSDPFSLSPSKARRAAEAAEQRREAEAKQDTTLDRIEVTGSRIKRADIESAQPATVLQRDAIALPPVREDARLERAEWLERIRARRDAGDVDDARASLKLFRKTHPRVRVPDDLRPLQR
ncbi:hypothetical protein [Lysobacter sp. cf310]|uniref:hypothetical protein n=1 Tax=Lysobacter sp. cf310 TaxID=1761790 RepID=UPI0008E77B07|nr:hypothetical protein [Lysobacter sp. cf310]SFK74948.1 hypothetical protein SAMN04487938_1832 [Lysobacter sp. cf310]